MGGTSYLQSSRFFLSGAYRCRAGNPCQEVLRTRPQVTRGSKNIAWQWICLSRAKVHPAGRWLDRTTLKITSPKRLQLFLLVGWRNSQNISPCDKQQPAAWKQICQNIEQKNGPEKVHEAVDFIQSIFKRLLVCTWERTRFRHPELSKYQIWTHSMLIWTTYCCSFFYDHLEIVIKFKNIIYSTFFICILKKIKKKFFHKKCFYCKTKSDCSSNFCGVCSFAFEPRSRRT